MANAAPTGETHVVVGGSGLLGSAIVRLLKARGEKKIYNLDIREPPAVLKADGVEFVPIDICSFQSVDQVFSQVRPDVVHHTASPLATQTVDKRFFEKVNVQGTGNIIEACQRADVKKLIYTSSSGVVFVGEDNINVDERMPYPDKTMDAYNDTKMRAERLVLDANTDEGAEGLKTVSIRPSGIFGPHDRQLLPPMIGVLKSGRHNVQLGENNNLVDWTYVDNVAHGHLLAADKLSLKAKPYLPDLLGSVHLPDRRTGLNDAPSPLDRDVPTSKVRQDVAGATDYARSIANTASGDSETATDLRPVIRNKFDQFFHYMNPEAKSPANPIPDVVNLADEPLSVAGQAFFVTNGQPIPFWDFLRAAWREYDPDNEAVNLKKVWAIPRSLGLIMGDIAGWISASTGRPAGLSRYKVLLSTATRFHNIEKARRLLDYEPIVGMEEGIKRAVAAYKEEERATMRQRDVPSSRFAD